MTINPDIFAYIFLIVSCLYFVLLLLVHTGLNRLAKPKEKFIYAVSVIITARNEENRILPCLKSLAKLDYPEDIEKIQMPHLASIYGAMLADVDCIIMGAGLPLQIPKILDSFAKHEPESYKLFIQNAINNKDATIDFDPKKVFGDMSEELKRPDLYAIVSSNTLANILSKKVNGLIIEDKTAGGHNANPRGNYPLNEKGEPVYGPKDEIDLDRIASLKVPWWIGGGYGSSEKLKYALGLGANGIQFGTLAALSNESGLDTELKKNIIDKIKYDDVEIYTSPRASPTGFSFKVAKLDNTISEKELYDNRTRNCPLGYLQELVEIDGEIAYRCSAEPVDSYLKKGGKLEDIVERNCICNALMSTAGLAQILPDGSEELPIVTLGDDLDNAKILLEDKDSYSAVEAVNYILNKK